MGNIRIKTLLLSMVIAMIMGVAVLLIFMAQNLTRIETTTKEQQRLSAAMLAAKETRFHVVQIQQFLTDVAATHDEGAVSEAKESLRAGKAALESLATSAPKKRSIADSLSPQIKELFNVGLTMAKRYISEGVDAGNALMKGPGGFDEASLRLAEKLEELVNELGREVGSANDAMLGAQKKTFTLLISFSVGGLLLLMISMAVLYNNVIPPLNNVQRALRDINRGHGDLTKHVPSYGGHEIGTIVNEFNSFVSSLRSMIIELVNHSSQLSNATSHMNDLSKETTQVVDRQRKETDQVADSVNEMTATSQEVAGHAAQAASATQEVNSQALNGKHVVSQSIEAINTLAGDVDRATEVINNLEKDSESIGSVLDVIRDIADQTNLLALNAAIEAARAGEQGRGFAVVADEVRTLASRTQESTQEIQAMIERLQTGSGHAVEVMEKGRSQAEKSVEQAAKGGEALESISTAIETINNMTIQIASAAEEQTAVTEEINRSVNSIREATEATADGANKTASSGESLAHMAGKLQSIVNRFTV